MSTIRTEFFTVTTGYKIVYKTEKPVPIQDVIESLKNLEKLILRTPIFIEKAYSGIEVVEVSVHVDSLQTGSLIEDFVIKYVFKNQDNYQKAQEVFSDMLNDNTALRTVVAMGIGGFLVYGVMSAIGGSSPAPNVAAYNNTIVNVGADAKLTGKDIELILSAVKDQKQLAQQAIGALKPAKNDPKATVEIEGVPELTMSEQFISEVPVEYEPPVPIKKTEEYSNLPILIYASDKDKSSSSWAGSVPGLIDKRIKFTLADTVNPAELHGKTRVYADVTVTSHYNKKKKSYEHYSVEINAFRLVSN